GGALERGGGVPRDAYAHPVRDKELDQVEVRPPGKQRAVADGLIGDRVGRNGRDLALPVVPRAMQLLDERHAVHVAGKASVSRRSGRKSRVGVALPVPTRRARAGIEVAGLFLLVPACQLAL